MYIPCNLLGYELQRRDHIYNDQISSSKVLINYSIGETKNNF